MKIKINKFILFLFIYVILKYFKKNIIYIIYNIYDI